MQSCLVVTKLFVKGALFIFGHWVVELIALYAAPTLTALSGFSLLLPSTLGTRNKMPLRSHWQVVSVRQMPSRAQTYQNQILRSPLCRLPQKISSSSCARWAFIREIAELHLTAQKVMQMQQLQCY